MAPGVPSGGATPSRGPRRVVSGLVIAVARFLPLMVALFRRRDVGKLTKAIPLLGLLYVVVPIDAIPDVVLLLGQTDDGGVGVGSLLAFFRMVPRETVASTLDAMNVDNRVARGALMAVHDAPRLLLLLAVGLVVLVVLIIVVAAIVVL